MPSLFVIQGRDQGTRFDLVDEVLTIGRDASNPIHLQDTEVSRKHAELARRDKSYLLTDLRSSNGTFVNDRQVETHALVSGDRVRFGRTVLLYHAASGQSAEELARQINIVPTHQQRDDSRIVRSITQQEGSQLFEALEQDYRSPRLARARGNLQIMYRTAMAVSHTLDIDQLLKRIMEFIFEWVEADRGCVLLFDPESRKLHRKVFLQRNAEAGEQQIEVSRTILDYVIAHNEGVLTSNAKEDARWDTGQSILRKNIREAICVPMQGRYDVVGVVYIDTAVPPHLAGGPEGSNKFSEEHLKLMVAIAHQAALAVEDTQYYKGMVQAERLAAVGQTVATLSHHVKNVLQGIRGGSYLIELGLSDHARESQAEQLDPKKLVAAAEMIRKGWGIVDRNQEKISTLVMDMLTFSKQRDPEPAPANINEIVSDVVEILQHRAKDLNVEIVWRPANNMPTLMFDPDGMHRAVLNVVTNAIDACDEAEPGRVEVNTEYLPDERLVRVVVSDNGVGISQDDLEHIFTLFVSKKGGRGTGLGLPVSQKIIKEHGGRIGVHSELGQGSHFTLEWPAVLPGDSAVRKSATGQTMAGRIIEEREEGDERKRV